MAETSIAWTDRTINPIRARNRATKKEGHFCEKVSPGCAHCYSAEMNVQQRFLGTGLDFIPQNREKVEIFFDAKRLEEVRKRKKPTKYFWCDMTDLFGEWVPDDWINQCVRVMADTPQHIHQVLTKRAERMFQYFDLRWSYKCEDTAWHPLPNLWLGVSVEDQARADERIPLLLQTPAAIRFLSVEPLLGPVILHKYLARCHCGHSHGFTACPNTGGVAMTCSQSKCDQLDPLLNWVIAGGESGSKRRPCEVAWFESLRQQCEDAGIAFFMKQDGALRPGTQGRLPSDLWQTKQFPKGILR